MTTTSAGETVEVLADMRPRLEAAGRDVADCRDALELAITRRNELVVAAVDEGMNQREVARLVKVGPPHVVRILAENGSTG